MTIAQPRARLRVAALALATLVAAVVGLGSAAAPASAYSEGCRYISDGTSCLYIYGPNGTAYVEKLVQARSKIGGLPWICDYKARFTITTGYGAVDMDRYTSTHVGCSYFPRATRTLGVNKGWRNNSTVCGTWYENGSGMGKACNKLYGN